MFLSRTKKSVAIFGFLLSLAGAAHATVSIDIDAGQLLNATGMAPEPTGGLLQLIASSSGTFTAPTSSSYTGGNSANVVLASFPMNSGGGTNEVFYAANSLTIPSGFAAGNQLLLRFYPSLTAAAAPAAPTLSTTYGQVRSGTIEFGASGGVPGETAWVLPADGTTINLEYVTVSNGGTYANNTAYASNVVLASVPEPSTYTIIIGLLMGLLGLRTWKRRGMA